MTLDEARTVLGVAPTSSPDQVRDAYLGQVRLHHPDVTEHPVGAGERTATIIEAYRLLRDRPAAPAPTRPTTSPARGPTAVGGVEVISDEAIWVDAAGPLVTRHLLDAADALGEVSYVDPSAGLVQVTIRPSGGPTCWLTVSIHARPGGTVLVATLESIEAAPTPAAAPIVRALGDDLRARLALDGKNPISG